MTIQEFHKGMRHWFKIDQPGEFLDPYYLLKKEARINLVMFDEWLHNQIGEYEEIGTGMAQALRKHYGPEAMRFIQCAI